MMDLARQIEALCNGRSADDAIGALCAVLGMRLEGRFTFSDDVIAPRKERTPKAKPVQMVPAAENAPHDPTVLRPKPAAPVSAPVPARPVCAAACAPMPLPSAEPLNLAETSAQNPAIDVRVDFATLTVFCRGASVRLSPGQVLIVMVLADVMPDILPFEAIAVQAFPKLGPSSGAATLNSMAPALTELLADVGLKLTVVPKMGMALRLAE